MRQDLITVTTLPLLIVSFIGFKLLLLASTCTYWHRSRLDEPTLPVMIVAYFGIIEVRYASRICHDGSLLL